MAGRGAAIKLHPMPNLLTYQKFYSAEEADAFTKLLEQSNITFKIEHERDSLDKVYTGESLDPMFAVKIPEDRFEAVNAILLADARMNLTSVEPDYYLFAFTNEELLDVLKNNNEWNYFDQALAEKILTDRYVALPVLLEKNESDPVYVPASLERHWLVLEYIVSILLGYVGIVIGLATAYAFKVNKDGTRVKLYDEATRMHGKIMLGIGIVRTLLLFVMPLFI